ncbi:uncharacterized protein LOC126844801 isoform X2 [Adelges cooleyi]|nr:uncharacterized protein LOC126844801 isoform X2 [Adelges cooleyi]
MYSSANSLTKQLDKLGVLPDGHDLRTSCTLNEERWLRNCILETFPICPIAKIESVNHKQMYGMYLLRKADLELQGDVEERLLYHVTSQTNALASMDSGLDWRRTKRAKFGKGVSFSDDANYANFYADNRGPDSRAILVCSVLIGRSHRLPPLRNKNAVHNIKCPPAGCDTTVSSSKRVYVKYNDFEFYPKYIVYYVKPDLNQSRLLKEQRHNAQVRQISATEFRKPTTSAPVVRTHSVYHIKAQPVLPSSAHTAYPQNMSTGHRNTVTTPIYRDTEHHVPFYTRTVVRPTPPERPPLNNNSCFIL